MKLATILAAATLIASTGAQAALVTLDFESGTPGNAIGTLSGATFTNGFYFQCGGGCPPPATGIFASGSGTTSTMTVTFATTANYVSFVNVSNSSLTATAYDSLNNFLGSTYSNEGFPISGATLSLNFANIKYVTFSPDTPQYQFGIDDLSFNAVPEPSTWALMIAGFGLTGYAMRRRTVALAA